MASIDHLYADILDVQVPCRRFFIKAQVTEDRQLPIVDEFVLRLVRITDRVSTDRLRRFFGFRDIELEAVLLGLVKSGLVAVEGDEVFLTPKASEMFQVVGPDGQPRLTEVDLWETDVWFDLVSRNMMRGVRYRPSHHLLELTEDPQSRKLPESFARHAFEANFKDFAKRIRKHPNADRLAIYAVSEVLPSGYGFQSVTVDVQFSLREAIEFKLAFPTLEENTLKFSALKSAVADTWKRLLDPQPSTEGVSTYERLTGDDRPRRLLEISDVREWTSLLHAGARTDARPIFGATYLLGNTSAFCGAVFDRLKAAAPSEGAHELIWFRPGGNSWGRSNRLVDALAEIRNAMRRADRQMGETILLVPRATPMSARKSCRKIFDHGILAPSGQLPADLEVILAPGLAACVIIHLPLGQHTLPIGSIVTDPDLLRRVERRVSRERTDSQLLWGVPAKEQVE